MSTAEFLHLVIGTAGHIDHGKSSLVERLTGHHPDTLEEERDRGLTINLGYATFRLGDGKEVGIIDVPGHERFIKNMVAGATGIRFVIFVIAADDSVMPQSREHLDILQILGVARGVVALTKTDLVDQEIVELATEEIREFVAGTFLESAPIVPVSSTTGAGFDDLRAEVERGLGDVNVRYRDLPFRMPVQRVFSAAGHGTVATGVPVSGRLEAGDTVEVLPHGVESRVRGLQAYGHGIDAATAGHRAAVNLSDVDYHTLDRGAVIAAPGRYGATRNVEVRFRFPSSQPKPLKHLSPIRFHTGTAEAVGRISLLDRKVVEPGEACFAQLFLQDDVGVAEGDAYILRSISPMVTLGGGLVVGSSRVRHRRFKPWVTEHLERKEAAIDAGSKAYLAEVVWGDGRDPRPLAELARQVHRTPGETEGLLAELAAEGEIFAIGGRGHLHREILDRMEVELGEVIGELHRAHPQSLFVPMRELLARIKLDAKLVEGVIEVLCQRGSLRRGSEGRVGRGDFEPQLTNKQRELKERVASLVLERGLSPPRRDELAAELSAGKEEAIRMLDLLVDEGRLMRLKDDRVFHREVIDAARTTLTEALARRGPLTAAEVKEHLDTSRRHLIPLLEFFDHEGITVRDGDTRRLAERVSAGESGTKT